MTNIPRVTGRELAAALLRGGFEVVRIKPVHAGETIGPGLLAKVLRDCEMTKERLRTLL